MTKISKRIYDLGKKAGMTKKEVENMIASDKAMQQTFRGLKLVLKEVKS